MPPKQITPFSHAQKFPDDFVIDASLLINCFCSHSVNWQTKASVTADIPLEKLDKLRPWLRQSLHENGSIFLANTLRREYLLG
ncbi:24708_t:CDS:2, partial [Gigaspora rosea]